MNIFYLDEDPARCARFLVDKHVVKMPLESCQMLSTAHRLLDGRVEVREIPGSKRTKRFYVLPGERVTLDAAGRLTIENQVCYYPTHVNHPSTVWTMASRENYERHVLMLQAMLDEYSSRYCRVYKSAETVLPFLRSPPSNLSTGTSTEPTPAMPDCYKVPGDSIQSYRNYYAGSKWRFAKWKHGEVPPWFIDKMYSTWSAKTWNERQPDVEKVLSKKTSPSHPMVMLAVKELSDVIKAASALEEIAA